MKLKFLMLCISFLVLYDSKAQRLSRDYQVTLLTNQVGYLPGSVKTCLLKTDATTPFQVIEITSGNVVFSNDKK